MANPFVAEIRIVGFNFPPKGWAFCDGQLMSISQNTALFSLLGTFYGGDGKSTFALPNLQGSAPLGHGQGPGLSLRDLGETGGVQNVTLLQSEMPVHNHTMQCSSAAGNQVSPANGVWAMTGARRVTVNAYAGDQTAGQATMAPNALATAGSSFPHNNMPPFLTLNFIIALQGIFPPRQ